MDLSPGTAFAGYRLQAVAGRGGMGVVYRATEVDLERTVALKLIAPDLAGDQEFRARFVRESRVAASIDHPNVIPIYAAGEHDGLLYIAMRYVEGEDMRALLRREGALEPGRAAQLVSQIAAALDAAHGRGIVHRDVKPANILLGAVDHAYLTDFGLTKNVGSASGVSHAGHWVGTLGYVAPEQIRGGHVDARADVYALGCLLFFALTGETPYRRESDEATMWAHLNDPPPSPSELVIGVPPAFDDVIARAMAKDPAARFPSSGDLGRAALAAAGRISVAPPERLVAVGEAAPSDDTPTIVSPDDVATQLGASGITAVTSSEQAVAATPTPRRRRGRNALFLGLTLLLPVLVLVAVLVVTGTDSGTEPKPTTAANAGEVRVGTRPNDVVVAAGYAWAVSNTDGTITRVQTRPPYRALPDPIEVGSGATALAADERWLWVVKQSTNRLLRYDLGTRRRVGNPIDLPPGVPFAVAVGEGSVWVGSRSGRARPVPQSVTRIDPKTGVTTNYPLDDGMQDLAVGERYVWVANRLSNSVTRLDPTDGTPTRIPVPGRPSAIAVGAGAVWVTIADRDLLVRIDARNLTRKSTVRVGSQPKGVAASPDAVWVSNESDWTVTQADPRSGEVIGDAVRVGVNPKSLAIDGHMLWVADVGQDALSRVVF